MGNNTLSTITGGIGRKEQVNQYKDALVGDILPRNLNGEVENLAGNLGSAETPFRELHATIINRGTTRKKKEFLTVGNHTFTVPDGVSEIWGYLVGSGSGASYITVNNNPVTTKGGLIAGFRLSVVAGDSISIFAGTGGADGASSPGQDTTLAINGVQSILCRGIGYTVDNAAAIITGNQSKFLSFCDLNKGSSNSDSAFHRWRGEYWSGVSYADGFQMTAGNAASRRGGAGIVQASGYVGGNGGAIIYYDLPSWATDPNNGVDA